MPGDKLSSDAVRKIAKLSRLELSDAQLEKYAGQMTQALGYIERLRELNLKDVQPLTNPADATNFLADDVPSAAPGTPGSDRLAPADLMKMAPANGKKTPPFISVPKVLGDDGGA